MIFSSKGLESWKQGVTGKNSSGDTGQLKKQFDDHENAILSDLPTGGKRHGVLSGTLPKIKNTFLEQGQQFALAKLNERSRSVLDKGLQRIADSSFGANGDEDIQAHDDQAYDLINKYVMSEAKFDGKDADAMYDKYLGYAGVAPEEPQEVMGNQEDPASKMEETEQQAAKEVGTASDIGGGGEAGKDELQVPEGKDEVYEGSQYRGQIQQEEQEKITEPTPSEPKEEIGSLSEKYETGGKGISTVSTGKGDPGGVSYGRYQMTSKDYQTGKTGGTVLEFVESDAFLWKDEFKGLKPGSKEFSTQWRELAEKHPDEFAVKQYQFIKRTKYDVIVAGTRKDALKAIREQ